MLPRKIIALLNPDETKPQFARSTTFIDGLNQAGDVFSRKFRVTKMGLRRAHWAEDPTQLKQKMVSLDPVITSGARNFDTNDWIGINHVYYRYLFFKRRIYVPSEAIARLSRLWSAVVLCAAEVSCRRDPTRVLSSAPAFLRDCQGHDACKKT